MAYVLIYFLRGNLPWEKIEAKKRADKYKKIFKLKLLITPEKLCENLPNEICEFLKYTRNLNFEQEPNYEYCCSLFNNVLIKIGAKNDLIFTWINNISILNKLQKNNNSNHYLSKNNNISSFRIFDLSKRKSSPQTRLYHSLQNSFEKNRFNSFSNINNNINDISYGENYIFSDKNISIDSNIQKTNQTLKIIKNASYNPQNKNEPRRNTTFKLLNNMNILRQENSIKNKKNINNNLNNNYYQSYTEKKYNNDSIETNFLKNKNNNILSFNTNVRQNNLKIINPVFKDYKMNSNKVKLINIEKNVIKDIGKNDIFNTIDNTFVGKISNNSNFKGKNNIIKITNIYKTKINYKNNYFNIIQNNNKDINQVLIPAKNINPNNIKINRNVFKQNKDNNLNVQNNNYNGLQLNKQLLLKKSNLIDLYKNVIKKDKNLINSKIKNYMNNLHNNKRTINKFIINNNIKIKDNLTLNENRVKKKISNSYEDILYNDDNSKKGENNLNTIDNLSNKYNKEKIFNKNNIIKINEKKKEKASN